MNLSKSERAQLIRTVSVAIAQKAQQIAQVQPGLTRLRATLKRLKKAK